MHEENLEGDWDEDLQLVSYLRSVARHFPTRFLRLLGHELDRELWENRKFLHPEVRKCLRLKKMWPATTGSKLLQAAILAAAAEGLDGNGRGGLVGYLQASAAANPRPFAYLPRTIMYLHEIEDAKARATGVI